MATSSKDSFLYNTGIGNYSEAAKNSGLLDQVIDSSNGVIGAIQRPVQRPVQLPSSAQITAPLYKSYNYYTTGAGSPLTTDKSKAMKTPASVSLNKDTGVVKISASSDFLNSDTYKNTYKPLLEGMSQTYRQNPDAKFALDEEGQTWDGSEKTVEEWVEALNAPNSQGGIAQVDRAVQATYNEIRGLNASMFTDEEIKAGKGWTENDIILKYQTVYETDDVKHYDSDLQALPQTNEWKSYLWDLFRKAGVTGYNGESGMITKEGWRQWYNRKNTSKEDIKNFYLKLRQEFHDAVDAKDPTRIARASALLSTMESEDPEIGGFGATLEWIGSAGIGWLDTMSDWASTFYSIALTPARLATKHVAWMFGTDDNTGNEIDEFFGSYSKLDEEVSDIVATQKEFNKALGSFRDTGIAAGEGLGVITKLAFSVWAGNRLSDAFGVIAGGALKKAIDVFEVSDKAGKFAKGLVNGVDAVLNLQSTSKFVSTADAAIKSSMAFKTGTRTVSAIVKVSELIGETIAECVVSDPKLSYRFLANSDDPEARKYVVENMAWNAGGWAVARVSGRAITTIGNTEGGKAVGRELTKASMKTRTYLADVADWVREKLPGRSTAKKLEKTLAEVALEGDNASVKLRNKAARLKGKLDTQTQNLMLRRAAQDVASSDTVEGFEQAIKKYKRIQNATDIYDAAQAYFFAEVRTNPTLARALDDVDDSVVEIVKALEKIGKDTEIYAQAGELGLKRALAYMDQDTANYISAVIDNMYIKGYDEVYDLSSALVKQQKANDAMIKTFVENASEELKLAADTATTRIQNFWSKYNDWAVAQGIYNKAEIQSLRASKLWGDNGSNYAKLQRAKEAYVPYSQRQLKTKGIMGELEERVAGSIDNYKDPILTIYNNLIGDAYDFALKNYSDTIKSIPGIYKTMDLKVAATETEFARKMQASGKQAVNEVAKSIDTVINRNSFDYESQFGKRAQAEIKKAVYLPDIRKEATANARKLGNLESRSVEDIHNLKTSATQRKTVVASLSGEQLANMASESQQAILGTSNSILAAQDALSNLATKTVADLDDTINGLGYIGVSEALEAIQKTPDQFDLWMSTLSENAQRQIRSAIRKANDVGKNIKVTGESFIKAMEASGAYADDGTSLAHTINSIIIEDAYEPSLDAYNRVVDELAETEDVRKLTAEKIHQSQVAQAETISNASQQRYSNALAELRKEYAGMQTYESIDQMIDDLVDEAWGRPGVQEAFTSSAGGLLTPEDAGKNLVMTELGRANNTKKFRTQVAEAFKRETASSFKEVFRGEKTTVQIESMVNKAANAYADMAEERLLSRAADARNALQEAGSQFSNSKDMFDEAVKLVKQIEGLTEEVRKGVGSNVVRLLNENGAAEFYEVSPAMASFFNIRPLRHIDTNIDRFLRALSSIFRSGTTGPVAVKSFMNQWVKDSGNAWVAGNAFRDIKESEELISTIFGDNIADTFKNWDPDELKILGLNNIEDAQELAALELARGRAISPTATEYGQYRFSKLQRAQQLADAGFKGLDEMNNVKRWGVRAQEGLEKFVEKLDRPSEFRESYLRNRVYSNAYADALKNGESIMEARSSAQFLMNNATTNFGRSLVHLDNLRRTIPYVGAAINGAKSFFRVAELDPVGVMSRIVGGFIVPVVALTVQNLGSEENRKVYQNIPEWQRASSFCFVVNGQVFTMPLPEQVADIIAPYRQFVEYLYGAQRGSFWELALNDLVGFSPVDFTGFTSVDINQIYGEPEDFWRKKMMLGSARLLSQFSNPLVKAGIIWATGIDPYTGNYIDNTRYTQDEDGNVIAVDYTSGWVAQKISELMNGITGSGSTMSAAMAQKIMQTLLGNANVEVIDGISDLVGAVGNLVNTGDFVSFLGEVADGPISSFVSEATSPFYYEVYDRALNDWNHAISSLQREKESILSDKKFQTILSKISTESDPEKLASLKAQRQNYIDDFQIKVLNVAKQLRAKYPSAVFDKYKFASVLNLMNMNANARGTNVFAETALAQSLTKDQKKQGQMMAYNTMLDMGFPDIEGRELTGYVSNNFGEIEVVYANPLSILAYSTTKQLQKDIHLANIEALISEKGWYDKRQVVRQQINAIYSKGNLKSKDYDKIDAIRVAYNGDLMKDLAPYIKTYTPEMVLGSQDVINLLAQYIQAPTSTLGYTKNKTDIRGSAQDAYIENYIKAIFKVNDSTYVGGRDYSGRGQWWKGE